MSEEKQIPTESSVVLNLVGDDMKKAEFVLKADKLGMAFDDFTDVLRGVIRRDAPANGFGDLDSHARKQLDANKEYDKKNAPFTVIDDDSFVRGYRSGYYEAASDLQDRLFEIFDEMGVLKMLREAYE
jgi:hypothetical protein